MPGVLGLACVQAKALRHGETGENVTKKGKGGEGVVWRYFVKITV